jgi:hypothetical protein
VRLLFLDLSIEDYRGDTIGRPEWRAKKARQLSAWLRCGGNGNCLLLDEGFGFRAGGAFFRLAAALFFVTAFRAIPDGHGLTPFLKTKYDQSRPHYKQQQRSVK